MTADDGQKRGGPSHALSLAATWMWIGQLRPAPGTIASASVLPLAWLAAQHWSLWGMAVAVAFLCAAAVWISGAYSAATGVADPKEVVIDEVAGAGVALILAPQTVAGFVTAIIWFRVFDILKPWPICWLERRLPGGWGIVADDVAAGLAAGAVTLLLNQYGLLDYGF